MNSSITTHIITSEDRHTVRSPIDQGLHELESGKVHHEDLAFITKLSKESEKYKNAIAGPVTAADGTFSASFSHSMRAGKLTGQAHFAGEGTF